MDPTTLECVHKAGHVKSWTSESPVLRERAMGKAVVRACFAKHGLIDELPAPS